MEAYFDNKTNILNTKIRTLHDHLPIYSVITNTGLFGRKMTLLKDLNPLPGDPVVVGVIHWREKVLEVRGARRNIKDVKRRRAKGEVILESTLLGFEEDEDDYDDDVTEAGDDEEQADEEQQSTAVARTLASARAPSGTRQGQGKQNAKNDSADPPSTTSINARVSDVLGKVKSIGWHSLKSVQSTLQMANVRMWRWNSSRREYALSYRHGLWRAIMLVRKSTSTGDERMNILAGKMHVPPRPTLFGKPEPIKLLLSRVALEADEVFLMLALIYSEARRQDRAGNSSDMG